MAADVLDPDLEIIDAHHHFSSETAGVSAGLPQYLPADFAADCRDGHRVTASVYIECRWRWNVDATPLDRAPLGEIEAVAEVAEELQRNKGVRVAAIVGHADLRVGTSVGDLLDLMSLRGRGLFAGVRHSVSWDTDPALPRSTTTTGPHLLANEQWRRGFAQLAPRGLVFDAMLLHPQASELVALARRFTETTVVVDHLGTPVGAGRFAGHEDAVMRDLYQAWRDLAACPNVVLKLGGIGMRFVPGPAQVANTLEGAARLAHFWGPHVQHAIEVFGADRCMFESNFPVDRALCDYRTLWNAYKMITDGASATERHWLFAGTARRVYRTDRKPVPTKA